VPPHERVRSHHDEKLSPSINRASKTRVRRACRVHKLNPAHAARRYSWSCRGRTPAAVGRSWSRSMNRGLGTKAPWVGYAWDGNLGIAVLTEFAKWSAANNAMMWPALQHGFPLSR
jgi:hypothetical protein